MNPERGMQAAFRIVLAFSILWTIAIVTSENDRESTALTPNQLGLVVNGTRYILDPNAKFNEDQTDERFRIIYSATPIDPRKLKATPGTQQHTQPPLRATKTKSSENSTDQENAPLLPRYAWLMFIAYHVRRFVKKRRVVTYEEDFFVTSGMNRNLECGIGMREYDADFLSVDNSVYGSMSDWNGEDLDKFDASSQNSEDLLNL